MNDNPTPRRKAISKRLRYEVLKRDGHRCRYCGATAEDEKLTVDHVIPVALGGATDPTNLVTACSPCNNGKTSTNPDDALVADVDEAAQAMAECLRLANLERIQRRDEMRAFVRRFHEDIWGKWKLNATGKHLPLPGGWDASIERFLSLGLDLYDLDRATSIAMGSKATGEGVFAYMCGVCWNEIREMQDAAKSLMLDGIVSVLDEEEIL